MTNDLKKADGFKTGPEASMGSMVGGIVDDTQKLLVQHFNLLRSEIAGELRQARTAAVFLGIGSAVTGVGSIFLLLMVVHGLHLHAEVPLWGCFGIVGGILTAVGAGFLFYGGKEAGDVHLMSPPESAAAMKESLRWVKEETGLDSRTDRPEVAESGKP
jgi:Putative Actinobacterial Holin-X, holin superfamily III